jgi:hypothetical protein
MDNRQHLPPNDGGKKPVVPPTKPVDARRSVISPSTESYKTVGCLDCPHPDYCAGMSKCERSG